LLTRFYRRFDRLARLPGTLGTARPELRHDLRSMPESGYIIFFRYLDDVLEIVNVLHGSRDIISFYDTGDDR
jgi:toxin ParE1/3/4